MTTTTYTSITTLVCDTHTHCIYNARECVYTHQKNSYDWTMKGPQSTSVGRYPATIILYSGEINECVCVCVCLCSLVGGAIVTEPHTQSGPHNQKGETPRNEAVDWLELLELPKDLPDE